MIAVRAYGTRVMKIARENVLLALCVISRRRGRCGETWRVQCSQVTMTRVEVQNEYEVRIA
jgi:hypothetical protein